MAEADSPPEPMSPLEFFFVRIPYYLTGVVFLAATLINIANVVGRYVFSRPIFWAEEVLVFMVIWGVFLSAVSITFSGRHLNMDLFYAKFEGPWRYVVNAVIV